jgi:hypothetical protein
MIARITALLESMGRARAVISSRDCANLVRFAPWLALLFSFAGCASTSQLDALAEENARLRADQAKGTRAEVSDAVPDDERQAAVAEEWSRVPLGDFFVPWEESLDLGWAKLRIREVKPCAEGRLGVLLEVANRGDIRLDAFRLDQAATLLVGGEAKPGTQRYDPLCDDHAIGMGIDGQTTGALWLKFEAAMGDAELLALDLEEPHGLAKYRLRFALKKAVAAPDDLKPTRLGPRAKPPATRIGDPVETAFFRITAVSKAICGPPDDNGYVPLGIELFVESFTNVPLLLPSAGTLRDDAGFEHSEEFNYSKSPCIPRLPREIEPGESGRGFLSGVKAPSGAKKLTLRYHIGAMGAWGRSERIDLEIGDLPEPSTPKAVPSPQWEAPKAPTLSHRDYRITVTSMARCVAQVENGKMWLGVEVLVENRSRGAILLHGTGTLEDDQAYHHSNQRYGWDDKSPCGPELPSSIEPGSKARGWIHAFRVPVDIGPATLSFPIFFAAEPQREDKARLAVGRLR